MRMRQELLRTGVGLFVAATMLTCGCAQQRGLITLSRGGAEVIYDPGVDRILYFGAQKSASAIYLSSDAFRPPRGRYTFRGGSYTWLAPQSEWVDVEGNKSTWPPEAGADRGPMTIVASDAHSVSVRGPVLHRGVHEEKRYALNEDGTMTLEVKLISEAAPGESFSIWSTTAGRPGSVIAVPAGEVRFSDEKFKAAWEAASEQKGPWVLIDTRKMNARGKAFIDAAPVVGVWNKGQWFIRCGNDSEGPRHPDDTPIEIYIMTRMPKIEIELLGPYLPSDRAGTNAWSETWTIVKSKEPSIDALAPFAP